jgi:hypothetical protein
MSSTGAGNAEIVCEPFVRTEPITVSEDACARDSRKSMLVFACEPI